MSFPVAPVRPRLREPREWFWAPIIFCLGVFFLILPKILPCSDAQDPEKCEVGMGILIVAGWFIIAGSGIIFYFWRRAVRLNEKFPNEYTLYLKRGEKYIEDLKLYWDEECKRYPGTDYTSSLEDGKITFVITDGKNSRTHSYDIPH